MELKLEQNTENTPENEKAQETKKRIVSALKELGGAALGFGKAQLFILCQHMELAICTKNEQSPYTIGYQALYQFLCCTQINILSYFNLCIFVSCSYLFIYKIQFSGFIKESLLLAFICIITISPWMIKIYNYHSDIRVLKTFE